ncbi:hypothetical protein [Streptomyces sp. NPDC101455]|uniref:hypothetical protein n=1 Tax=Streptomyces sp. NPDC101455 TaxID=3366142 RepID=UPI0037FBED60
MTNGMNPTVARLVAGAERITLTAVIEETDAELERTEQELAALDRIEAAGAELERLERLYPGRSTTREMLVDAGVSPDSLGLREDDSELIDKWMAEDGIRDVT